MFDLRDAKPYEIVLLSGVLTQLLKFLIYGIANRRPSLRILVTTNGLPSSYAVVLSCLVTVIALNSGLQSGIFAGAMVFSGVVLHDLIRVQGSVNRGQRATAFLVRSVEEGNGPDWAARLAGLLGDRGHRPLHVGIGMVVGLLLGLTWHPG